MGGLLRLRTCWLPTVRGWLAIIVILTAVACGAVRELHPFLAPMDPLPDGALVIEGWVNDAAMKNALLWVDQRHYYPVFVTGGPIAKGAAFSEFGNLAEWTAASVRQSSEGRIEPQPVPFAETSRDRTFTSAIALKAWMEQHGGILPKITVFSEGPHSRRSHLLYQKVFRYDAKIGVISSPPQNYDANRWWTSSEGFRTVTDETIAYLYARLLFWRSS
jgi:hypothetical protein